MIRCHCTAPAIYQGRCLFHQGPEGVRPNIDAYTGQIRETPAEKKAREKAARLAVAAAPRQKVIRQPQPRRQVPTPDETLVLDAYNKGQSILAISKEHGYSRRAVTSIVHQAGLITYGPTHPLDLDALKADYLAGIVGNKPAPVDVDRLLALYASGLNGRAVARELGVSEKRVHSVLAEHGALRPRLFGAVA